MAGVFDATQYYTRRQADLRYVHNPITAAQLAGVLGGSGLLAGSALVPQSITGLQISDEAIALRHMLGDVRPPKIIPGGDALPALPDPLYPIGAQVTWMRDGGKLWINRNDLNWELTVRTIDISGSIVANQFAADIKPVHPVIGLPTLEQDPVTHLPTNYAVSDVVLLKGTGKMYQLVDDGAFNYHWDAIIKASNIDVSAGKITAEQLDVDSARIGILTVGAVKAEMLDAEIITVNQLGVGNATVDTLVGRRIKSQYIDFTSLSGDNAAINFITAGMIVTGAVTTDKLIVGSFDNLCEDGSFELASAAGAWSIDANGLAIGGGLTHTGSQSISKTGGSGATSAATNRMVFDVKSGDKIYFEGWAFRNGANGAANINVKFYQNRACTVAAAGGGSDVTIAFTSADTGAAWKFKSSNTAVAPADAKWARISISITGQNAGTWAVDDVYIRKMVGAAYISDLTADFIKAGTLDCSLLTVSNLSANAINTGTLNCANLTVQNINGTSVVDGTISNQKLGNISADKINTGTLDASVVIVTNLNANNINAGSLSVARLSAGTMTVSGANSGLHIAYGNIETQIWPGQILFYSAANFLGAYLNASGTNAQLKLGGTGQGGVLVQPSGIVANNAAGSVKFSVDSSTGDVYSVGAFDFRGGTFATAGSLLGYVYAKVGGSAVKIPYFS